MNKKVIKKWVKALRSGKYKQGTGKLRDEENNFCCLGVLTDLYIKKNKLKWNNGISFHYDFRGQCFTLTKEVVDWVMLDHDIESELIHMNDNKVTFKEIADYIEEYCL
jgi:hypothetical protein